MKSWICTILLITPTLSFAAQKNFDLTKFLKEFRKSPHKVLNSIPQKTNRSGRTYSLKEKFEIHHYLTTPATKSIIESNNSPEILLEGDNFQKNIIKMSELGLMKSKKLKSAPWSDDYWPIYKGVLGNRYADEGFMMNFTWPNAHNYVLEKPADQIVQEGEASLIDKLSPSEKYDLVLGLDKKGLTPKMWNEGKRYFEANGSVEAWMGICHGWAPASFMVARPKRKVKVKAWDGSDVTFYPSDIKALSSLLWAKSSSNINFIGGRCNSKKPELDDDGRIVDPDCLDINPGTWHISVVNKLGIRQESFVFDATFDYEVWNQPVLGYSYSYFNPDNHKESAQIQDAIIPIKDIRNDAFAKHRSKNAKYLVGIQMHVRYLVEAPPIQRDEDSSVHDANNGVTYVYDLELDENYNIVGGEWYQNIHPDFLWAPQVGARALSDGDFFLIGEPHWNGKHKLTFEWANAAMQSSRFGSPLALFVESLIKISNSQLEK